MARTMNTAGKFITLEKDNHRYEFFTRPVAKSNVDDTIAYYQPVIKHYENMSNGIAGGDDIRVTVEEGNRIFKELLSKGYKRVVD